MSDFPSLLKEASSVGRAFDLGVGVAAGGWNSVRLMKQASFQESPMASFLKTAPITGAATVAGKGLGMTLLNPVTAPIGTWVAALGGPLAGSKMQEAARMAGQRMASTEHLDVLKKQFPGSDLPGRLLQHIESGQLKPLPEAATKSPAATAVQDLGKAGLSGTGAAIKNWIGDKAQAAKELGKETFVTKGPESVGHLDRAVQEMRDPGVARMRERLNTFGDMPRINQGRQIQFGGRTITAAEQAQLFWAMVKHGVEATSVRTTGTDPRLEPKTNERRTGVNSGMSPDYNKQTLPEYSV